MLNLLSILPETQSQFAFILVSFSFLVVIGQEGKHILWTFGCKQETCYYLWPVCSFIWNHVGIVNITKSCALKICILPFYFLIFPLKSLGMESSAYEVKNAEEENLNIQLWTIGTLPNKKINGYFLNESPVFKEWPPSFLGIWCQQRWTL